MADPRPQHFHVAHSVYGAHGPRNDMPGGSPRPLSTKLKWPAGEPVEPQTIAEHITSAVARIPGLSSRQRAAVVAVMTEKVRDLHFARLVAEQLGPQPSDEGRIL